MRVPSSLAILLLVLALGAAFHHAVVYGRHLGDPYSNTRFVFYGFPAMIIVGTVIKMELQGQWPLTGLLVWLGNRSYSLYLVHLPIISGFLLLASRFVAHPGKTGLFLLTVAFLGLIALAMEMCYCFVEKPSHLAARGLARHFKGLDAAEAASPPVVASRL
jgi:peptidoglycan/LPS O-acetylase OafA/YrhL